MVHTSVRGSHVSGITMSRAASCWVCWPCFCTKDAKKRRTFSGLPWNRTRNRAVRGGPRLLCSCVPLLFPIHSAHRQAWHAQRCRNRRRAIRLLRNPVSSDWSRSVACFSGPLHERSNARRIALFRTAWGVVLLPTPTCLHHQHCYICTIGVSRHPLCVPSNMNVRRAGGGVGCQTS